jgi:RNA polymerase sigma-70 factor (ECF subfamily)
MFRADGQLRRWSETDDVLQNVMVRRCRALQHVTPASVREFFRLAAVQVRRELIDLARHYYGPHGFAAKHQSKRFEKNNDSTRLAADEPVDSSQDPIRLAAWSEFHVQIGALRDEDRELFDLIWYQGLSHVEAAQILQVLTRTIARHWQAARSQDVRSAARGTTGLLNPFYSGVRANGARSLRR